MIWLPFCSATVSTTTVPSSACLTVPVTVTSCSGKPMPRNWTESRFSARGSPPAAALFARATWAIVQRPCRMQPGSPADFANSGSVWIGLGSPEASA